MAKEKRDNKPNAVAGRIEKVQQAAADFLNRRVNRLSLAAKKIGLLFFGAAAGAICLSLIVVSLNGRGKSGFSINRITRPENIYEIPDRSIERIQRFKAWLDSLKNDPKGRRKYDSILLHRPGLPDSVNTILNLK